MAQVTAAQSQATAQAPRQRILRIGIVLGGKIIEERLIRRRETLTIGQSARASFSIPVSELPRMWPIFEVTGGGRYVLHVSEGMDGRLSDGQSVHMLQQLKASGQMQRSSQGWRIALPETARGKVSIGDCTLLFQFIMAPPLQPRPQLPHSVRGRFADRIDPYMAIVLACSLLVHGGLATYMYRMDLPAEPTPDEIPDRFAKGIMEKPIVLQEKKPASQAVGKELAKADEPGDGDDKGKPDKKPGGGDKNKPAGDKPAAPDHAAVQQAVQNTAVLKVLGARSESGSGRFADVTGGRDAGGDLGRGLNNVRSSGAGVAVATGPGGLGGGTRGPATGEIGTGKYTGTAGPSGPAAVGGAKGESAIKVDVRAGSLESIDEGGLDPEKVMRTIKSRYASGVQQCYQRALKEDSKLSGKLVVSFTVGPMGKVTKARASGLGPAVDGCVTNLARSWRFDKPEAGSAEFEVPFILKPGN